MIRVGLTGGIGSGKSTVARMLNVLQVPVFEADKEARRLMENDRELRQQVAQRFRLSIYPEGQLDRKALAAIVFDDPVALQALNDLVHPVVRMAFAAWADRQVAPYVVMEAAILAETGRHAAFDRIIVVAAPEELRIKRVMERDGVGEDAVRARMKNQASDRERESIADHIIHNNEKQLLIPQVLEVHQQLLALA